MTNWQFQRQLLIGFTFASAIAALISASFNASAGKRSVSAFTFPAAIPLPRWELDSSSAKTPPAVDSNEYYGKVLARQQYQYRQDRQQLSVEMQYEAGSLGNIQGYITYYSPIQWQSIELLQSQFQPGIGFVHLFTYQGRSHLVSCINPRGGSTVTAQQFFSNRRTYDLQWGRILPWFLGQESLIDRRCLWVDISLPLDRTSALDTYPILKQAWQSWYGWWRDRFPKI